MTTEIPDKGIPDGYKTNFQTLSTAFEEGAACLLQCRDAQTGEPVYAICAVNRVKDDFEFIPFARLFDGNPFEQLVPP